MEEQLEHESAEDEDRQENAYETIQNRDRVIERRSSLLGEQRVRSPDRLHNPTQVVGHPGGVPAIEQQQSRDQQGPAENEQEVDADDLGQAPPAQPDRQRDRPLRMLGPSRVGTRDVPSFHSRPRPAQPRALLRERRRRPDGAADGNELPCVGAAACPPARDGIDGCAFEAPRQPVGPQTEVVARRRTRRSNRSR